MKVFSNAITYADTRDMSREEWLDARRNGIGGSDASAIMGLNPYSSPLRVYLDKLGQIDEKETSEAMRQGVDLEQYVADRFVEALGKKVKKCNKILRHRDYPWMLANIDRAIVGENAGLECKTTSAYSKFDFEDGEINPHYYWQAMHYLAVTGADSWYVAVLVLGKSFHIFQIGRDEAAISNLINAEREFWEEHVMVKVPPLPTGNDADDEALDAMYPQGDGTGEAVELDGNMESMLDLRALKVAQRDKVQDEIDEIDQRIKASLGEHERAISGVWDVRWTNTNTSRIDTKALRQKYPEIAAEVTTTKPGRRFSVKRVKEA